VRRFWSAATRRRFSTGQQVAPLLPLRAVMAIQSGDKSPHSIKAQTRMLDFITVL
jgi:hypothetical protein